MKIIARHEHRTFLKDHPPVMRRLLLSSNGAEQDLVPGSVLGTDAEGKLGLYVSGSTAEYILAEFLTIPATGDAYGDVYVHAAVVTGGLTWADGLSATDQNKALADLRTKGIYASEA